MPRSVDYVLGATRGVGGKNMPQSYPRRTAIQQGQWSGISASSDGAGHIGASWKFVQWGHRAGNDQVEFAKKSTNGAHLKK